ncbi:MAG TPA: FeS-binding protein [Dehalococcoidia bacterium]|jgi:ABC-type methionine transport system ATPase subunit|nr:FeS-binding protein [Dehalococcoidia bacterium]
MAKRRVTLTFNEEVVTQPIIYNLGQQFKVATNILQANVTEDGGWIEAELEGETQNIEDGIAWAISRGVRVDEPAVT